MPRSVRDAVKNWNRNHYYELTDFELEDGDWQLPDHGPGLPAAIAASPFAGPFEAPSAAYHPPYGAFSAEIKQKRLLQPQEQSLAVTPL